MRSDVAVTAKRQTARELRDLQRLMAGVVMRPLGPAQRMQRRWLDGRPMEQIAAGFIKPNDRLTSYERLEIYNRQYWFRVLDSFYEDYPGLRAILGDRKFLKLATVYLANHPSTSFTLRNLGQRLMRFVAAEPRWTAPRRELALDMARLEWARIEAFDNEARPPLSTDEILDHQAAKLRLRLQPHLTLLRLNYPLDDFLISLRKDAGLRGEASNAMRERAWHSAKTALLRAKRGAVCLAVHRYRNRVFYKRLEPAQFSLLSLFQPGRTLLSALDKWAAFPEATSVNAEQIKKWFEHWSALGWFCRPTL